MENMQIPKKALKVKLKFHKSEKTGAYIAFMSQNKVTKMWRGVRETDIVPKQACVVDARLSRLIVPGVLYDAVCVPMKSKSGFVAIQAEACQFKATIETLYVPKAVYQIAIKFGYKTVTLDFLDAPTKEHRTISGICSILEKRVDVRDLDKVIDDFKIQAYELAKNFRRDGYCTPTD